MSELEYCAFCDGGYAHSGICDKCTTEIGQTGKGLADCKADRVAISQKLSDALDALFASNKQLAEANRKLAERINDDQRYLVAPLCNAEKALDDCQAELAEAQTEVERLALEIENQQYTITCASEENQQLKESLADARAEIERLKNKENEADALLQKCLDLFEEQVERGEG